MDTYQITSQDIACKIPDTITHTMTTHTLRAFWCGVVIDLLLTTHTTSTCKLQNRFPISSQYGMSLDAEIWAQYHNYAIGLVH